GGCFAQNANTAPRNGPLHGVARTVVRIPLANAPTAPSRAAISTPLPDPTKPGMGISQTPKKLSAITNTTHVSPMLNEVERSPQAKPAKAASVAKTIKTAKIPTV